MASESFPMICSVIFATLILIASSEMVNVQPSYRPVSSSRDESQANVVAALRKTGKFNMAASLLDSLDMDVLPASTTLLVPNDTAASKFDFKSFNEALPILEYHVLTRQFSFHDLLQLQAGTRLQTLLNDNTVLITSNGSKNYTIDNVRINRPDIYFDDTMVIHGISGVLNSSLYGKNHLPFPPKPSPSPTLTSPSPSTSPASSAARPIAPPNSDTPVLSPSVQTLPPNSNTPLFSSPPISTLPANSSTPVASPSISESPAASSPSPASSDGNLRPSSSSFPTSAPVGPAPTPERSMANSSLTLPRSNIFWLGSITIWIFRFVSFFM